MECVVGAAKAALHDQELAPIWFRQLHHNNIFQGRRVHVTLHEVQIRPTGSTYSAAELRDPDAVIKRVQAAQSDGAKTTRASFVLIKIHCMPPDRLLATLAACEIDDGALLVLNSGAFHFQHFQREKSAFLRSFGLAYNVATMLWSHNSQTSTIRAIAFGESDRPFGSVHLERFKADLAHPIAPGLLALQVQLEIFHGRNRNLVKRLRDVETATGHRAEDQSAGKMDFDRLGHLDLNLISQSISNIQYEAFSLERSFKAMKALVEEMQTLTASCLWNFGSEHESEALEMTMHWRIKSIESLLEQTRYLLNRVGVQNTVVFNLRTQRDAHLSLEVAGHSKDLASAAKRDSSSMQTIAVLTMAVLPATFFAALFAMPLLKWDEQPVVQSQFWIYLAFTLPCTALVFILWISITKQWLVKRIYYGLQELRLE